MSRYGAPTFNSLLKDCVLWFPGSDCAAVSGGGYDTFPIMPSGVTVTNNGTFTKTDLGNNKSVLNFDGSTNYTQLTNSNNEFTTNLTNFNISTWVKPTVTSGLRPLFVICGGVCTWNATNGLVYSIFIFNNNLYFQWYTGKTTYGSGNVTFTSTDWSHLSLNKANGHVYIFINGTIALTIYNATISLPTNRGYIRIGNDWANYFIGNLKDMMYISRPLSVEEIKLLMNRTHPITGAGLMPANGDYYRMA